ncbi:MAG: DUF4956 domain-containing protein [Acidobacteriota bacterium]
MYSLQGIDIFSPALPEIIIGLVLCLCCSYLITVVYRYTYRGAGYSNGFITSIIALSLITSLVIMVIGNNLARAFGLVGALSIIRFRTAVKDTIDIVYIFFALAIGMAAGVGYFKLAVVGTGFISLVLIGAAKQNLSIFRGEQFLLQLQVTGGDVAGVKALMMEYCSSFELINVKSGGNGAAEEFSYYVNLKRKKEYLEFVRDLKAAQGVQAINLFRDEEHV